MFRIDINYGELQALDLKVKKMPRAVAEVLRAVAQLVSDELRIQLQKIYDAPIPVNRRGRPLWRRTGALMEGRAEIIVMSGREAQINIRGRAEIYAARRHELGVSWMPKNPAGGIVRRNPFMTDTVEAVRPKVQAVVDEVFARETGL